MPRCSGWLVGLCVAVLVLAGCQSPANSGTPDLIGSGNRQTVLGPEFVSLLKDGTLEGWSLGQRDEGGADAMPAEEVFSVYGDVIHVYAGGKEGSGQRRAILTTDASFSAYVFEVDFCWLANRFDQRKSAERDAGILFHIPDGPLKVWPSSVEMQIGESEPGGPYVTGDLWVLGADTRVRNARVGKTYKPDEVDGELAIVGAKPWDASRTTVGAAHAGTREWNTLRVVVDADRRAIFLVNGEKVNEVFLMEREIEDEWKPLKSGRIGLQAEWAEMLYRNPRIRAIKQSDLD